MDNAWHAELENFAREKIKEDIFCGAICIVS